MSGVVIIRELIASRPQITALVPAARIHIGFIPQGSPLPAIGVSSIGGNEERTVARQASTSMIRERVQVTVYARSYAEQEKVLIACKLGSGVHTGIVFGLRVNAVETLGTNPAMPPSDDKIYEQSRDFMVTFKEAN